MARSLSNAKILSVFISEGFSNAVFRRGFAAAANTASQESVSSGGTVSATVLKKKKVVEESSEKAPWVPDPKTGYYRPETGYEEIDAAELRAALLNNKQ